MLPRVNRNLGIALAFLAVLSLLPAYLRAYTLTGPSDIPTLLLGDKAVVSNAAYGVNLPYSKVRLFRSGSPKRGDLVLLHILNDPGLRFPFCKRVMGLPGETVEIRENQIVVDGRPVRATNLNPADFVWVPRAHPIGSSVQNEDGHWITFTPGKSELRNYPPIRLAERQYFVLGDNRDDSKDSREFGPVSEDLLLGKVIVTLATGERTR
jgi:signal peptidase I